MICKKLCNSIAEYIYIYVMWFPANKIVRGLSSRLFFSKFDDEQHEFCGLLVGEFRWAKEILGCLFLYYQSKYPFTRPYLFIHCK